jgi:hypothetical protein
MKNPKDNSSESTNKINQESISWRELCDNYVSEHYDKNRFDGGEYMGGNTETGLHGVWYYDQMKKGYYLNVVANEKTGKIVSAVMEKLTE